jgi:hypothetical protein
MLARTARHGIVRNMSQSAGIYQFESRLLMARRVSPNDPISDPAPLAIGMQLMRHRRVRRIRFVCA